PCSPAALAFTSALGAFACRSRSASFFFQAEDGIRAFHVTGVQTCALPISSYEDILESLRHSGFTVEQIVGAMAKKIMGVQKNEYSDANLAWEEKRSDRRGEDRWERRGDRKSGGRFENRGDRRGNDRFGDRRGGFAGKRSRTVEAGMTRLFFNLGRQDHLQPRDFVGAIAG